MPRAKTDFFDLYLLQENNIAWEDIKIYYRNITAPDQNLNPYCVGFDTETLNGYVKVITDSTGRYLLMDHESPEELLKFLCYKPLRDSLNFWYNIQYDFDSIVKHLPEENIIELVYTGKTEYKKYKIKYIPKKFFNISRSKHAYTYYDVAQFYEMSLGAAAYYYLGGIKNEDNLDRKLIGSSQAYWDENQEKIIKYCINDSRLTADLARHLTKTFRQDIDFSPAKYISKASISKQYFRNFTEIPNIAAVSEEAMYYAFNSYYGGRFEVMEKGNLGHCSLIDINSAYPYEIAELIDITKGKWRLTESVHSDAYYGFYKAKVSVKPDYICPLPYRTENNTICFPWGEWITFLTLQEIRAYEPYIDYEIIRGYEFTPKVIRYPFKEEIYKLYKQKQQTSKKDFKYSLYKILMNSLYGCFYEKIKFPGQYYYKAGVLFNPIYATLITANTRIKEFLEAKKFGNRCVAFATDSLLIKGKIPDIKNDLLGEFSNDADGKTTVIRAGIYKIDEKMKTRGIRRPEAKAVKAGDNPNNLKNLVTPNPQNYIKRKIGEAHNPEEFIDPILYHDLFEYIQDQPELTEYPILNYRPIHLKEAVRKTRLSVTDINLFMPEVYDINLNVDNKRLWDEDWKRGGDIFNKSIKSQPPLKIKEFIPMEF